MAEQVQRGNQTGLAGTVNLGTERTWTNLDTGEEFSNYADFAKDYADREMENRQSFSDSMQSALSEASKYMQGVNTYGSSIAYSPNAGMVNTVTINDFQNFSKDLPTITSGMTALANSLSQNTQFFGLTPPGTTSSLEDYMEKIGANKSNALDLPEDLKKKIINDAKLSENNPQWMDFVKEHQALAQWLSVPENYARVNDDIKNQTGISKLIQEGAYSAFRTQLEGERGRLYAYEANGNELNEEQKDRIKILNGLIQKFSKPNPNSGVLGTAGQVLGGFTPALGEGAKGAVAGATAGALAGAVATGGVTSIPLAIAGAGYGLVTSIAHREAQIGMGNLYGDIKEKTGQKATKTATAYGALVGGMNAITFGQVGTLTKLANETGVLKALGKQSLQDSVLNGVLGATDYATQEGIRQTYGIGRDNTLGDIMYNTAVSGGLNALFGFAISTPAYLWAGLHQLGRMSDASNTMSRGDYVTQANIINSMVRNTPLETVSVNGEALKNYMDSGNITAQDNRDFVRIVGSAEEFNKSLQTGTPIDVPLGDFITINPEMRTALLPDVSSANQVSLRDYQSLYDDLTSMSADKNITSMYTPDFQIYNMLQDSGNMDILNLIQDTEKAIKNNETNFPASEMERVVNTAVRDVEDNLVNNPMYAMAQEIENSKELNLVFDLQRFSNQETGEIDLRQWAKNHLRGMDNEHQQAILDEVARNYGFKSGAEFLNKLAKSPTRDEIRVAVRDSVQKSFRTSNSNSAELSLNLEMQKQFATNSYLYDLIEGKDIEAMTKDLLAQTDEKYKRRIETLTAQAKNVQNTTLVSEDSRSIQDARLKILQDEIKALKEEQKAEISRIKSDLRAEAKNRLSEQKEKDKEKLKAQREKFAEYKDAQVQYRKQLRVNLKEARKGQLTISKAKEQARENMKNMTIGEILNRGAFVKAIRQGHRKASTAFMKGDYLEAINQTNKVMSATAYIIESLRIQREVTKLDRKITSFSRKKRNFWGNEEAKAQADKILAIIGANKRGVNRDFGIIPLPQYLERMQALGSRVANIPDSIFPLFSVGNEQHLTKDLTLEQYQDTVNLLENISTIGKEQMSMIQHDLDVKVENVKEGILSSLRAYTEPKKGNAYNPTLTRRERLGSVNVTGFIESLENIDTWCTKLEGRDGMFRQFFINLRASRAEIKSRMSKEIQDRLDKLNSLYTKKEQVSRTTKNIFIEEMGVTVSRDDLIGLAMNAGCLDNWNKLFSINHTINKETGFIDEKLTPNIPSAFTGATKWDPYQVLSMLGKYLDNKDWDFVEGHWKLFDDLWGGAKEFEKARTGFTPQKAESHPFDVTLKDGTKRHFEGGFYPLSKDQNSRFMTNTPNGNLDSMLQSDIGEISQNIGVSTMTKQGHYETRTGAKYIISIDFRQALPRYFDNITNDIAFRDWAVMANNILKDSEVQREILVRHGDGALDLLTKSILDTVGTNYGNLIADGSHMIFNYLKRASSSALVGMNPTVIFQGILNPLSAVYSVKGWGVTDTIGALLKHGVGNGMFPFSPAFRKLVEENYNLSPLLRDILGGNPDFAIYRNYGTIETNQVLELQRKVGWVTGEAMATVDRLTIHPIFRGIVEQGLSRGLTQEQAVRRAETAIKRIVPSDKKWEQSNFINAPAGSWQSYMNGLASYSNTLFNNVVRYYNLSSQDIKEVPRMMVCLASSVIFASLMTDIIAFRSPLSTDDKKQKSAEGWRNWAVNAGVGAMAGMIPIVGEPVRALSATMTDNPYYGTRTPSGLGTLVNQVTTLALKVQNEKATALDVAEATAKSISFATGMPQYFINIFFNSLELFTDPRRTLEIRDLFKRRPYDERKGN